MIPLNSLLFLIFGFATAKVLSKDFLAPFLDHSGGVLLSYLITFVGFLVSLRGGATPTAERHRFWTIFTATIFLVGMITWRQSLVRMTDFTNTHDGAIQTEVAADMVLRGVNPYEADFQLTAFGQAPSPYRPGAVNLAWTHYAYPPAVILSAIPNVWLRPWLGPLSDTRWLYLAALGGLAAAVAVTMKSWERRSLTIILLLANPFIWLYAVAGFNDILSVAALVASAVLIERRQGRWGGVMMGVALAAKQTTWLSLPLWIWWLYSRTKTQPSSGQTKPTIIAMSVTVVGLFGPFFLWGPSAMFDDLIRYVSGSIPFAYPISGSTFLQFLTIFHLVGSPWDIIPVWPFQLTALGLTGWIGWRWIRRRPTASTWLAASTIMTLAVAMVSRFFNDNYLSAIVALGTAAYLLHHDTEHGA